MQLSDKGVRVSIIHTCNFKIVQTVSSLFPRCQNDRSLKMIHAAWVMVRQPGPWYMTYHYVREDLMSVITWRTRLVKIRHVFMLKWQIDKVSFHSNNKLIQVGSIWVQHSSHQIMLNSKIINSSNYWISHRPSKPFKYKLFIFSMMTAEFLTLGLTICPISMSHFRSKKNVKYYVFDFWNDEIRTIV